MSGAKHTPGPWRVLDEDIVGPEDAETERSPVVATLNPYSPPRSLEANAALIAAAPDLLAACEAVRRLLPPDAEWMTPREREMADALDAAIAKAKGGAR